MNFDFQSDSSTKYKQRYEFYKELNSTGPPARTHQDTFYP